MNALVIVLFIVGLALIAKGGDWFADGAIAIADHTGVPKALIGATLVSLATTMPEVVVSVVAVTSGSPETSVGNAIGSVIANVGLILAAAVLIHPLRGEGQAARVQVGSLIAVVLVLIVVARDLSISRNNGILLLLLMGAYFAIQLRIARQGGKENHPETASALDAPRDPGSKSMRRQIVLFVVGAVVVIVGSRLVVDNGISIARYLGIPELIVGLTLVSVGTSLPELVTSVTAALKRHTDLAAGNVLGASVLNVVFVLPVAALVQPLSLNVQTLRLDIPVALALIAVLAATLAWRGSVSRWVGGGMLAAYGAYVIYLFT